MKKILLILICFTLAGCHMYRQDIQQGNILTPDMVSQLKPGMTPDQVRYVMGTPVLTDCFASPDRWDYVYSFQPGYKGKKEQKRVTVFFNNGVLQRVETKNITP